MLRKLALGVLLVASLFFALASSVEGANDPRSTVYLIQDPVTRGNGSGVLINDGIMLTAAHVAVRQVWDQEVNDLVWKPNYDLKVVTDAGLYLDFEVIVFDVERDIALIRVNLACPCAEFAADLPDVDSEVSVVGFPLHGIMGVEIQTKGFFQGVHKDTLKIITTAPLIFGNSGGGVFNSDGDLIGIVSALAVAGGTFGGGTPITHLNFSVSIDTIKEFLSPKFDSEEVDTRTYFP